MSTYVTKNNILNRETENKSAVIEENISFEQQKEHFLSVAKKALPLWGYPADSKLILLNITENATYKVEHPHYESIVMRVHRLIYTEKESIMTEIAWILDLRKDTDLNLATPLPARDGTYVQTITTPEMNEQRHVVCFSFERGKALHDSHDDTGSLGSLTVVLDKLPKKLTVPLFCFAASAYDHISRLSPFSHDTLTSEDIAMYRTLGAVAATLRENSRQWKPPACYRRIEWNWEATFSDGWNNFYGMHYYDLTNILSSSDISTINACVGLMHKRILAYGKSPDRYGVIHSDLRMGNLLKDGDRITVLDFDDCGKGWYMYDIAGIVGFMEHRPDLKQVLAAIMGGYRSRAELSDEDAREIMTFVMMRRIGLLQAITYHLNNTDTGCSESAELTPEILAFYAKGTAVLAKRYIREYRDLPLPAACK